MSPQFYYRLKVELLAAVRAAKDMLAIALVGFAVLGIGFGVVQFCAKSVVTYYDYSMPEPEQDFGWTGVAEDDYGYVDAVPAVALWIAQWNDVILNVPLSVITFDAGCIALAAFGLVRGRRQRRFGRDLFDLERLRALAYSLLAARAAYAAAVLGLDAALLGVGIRPVSFIKLPAEISREMRSLIINRRLGGATAAA